MNPMNFDMGAYGVYIWPAYGVSALALACVTLWTVAAWRRAKARLAELEARQETPQTVQAP
jgi:heme exporter protein CcmD